MSVLWAVSLGLLALGPWGLSCLGGRTAMRPVEHHEPPSTSLTVAPHDEIPRAPVAKRLPPPSTDSEQAEFAALLADEADDADTVETLPAAPPPSVKDSHLSPKSKALVAKLLKVSEFALGGVCYAGQTSEGERLTLKLSHQSDAIAAFDWLANQSTPVAQLYAYWALRTLAPDHAQAHATELSHDRRKVMASHGCMGARYHVRYLAREVERRPMPAP